MSQEDLLREAMRHQDLLIPYAYTLLRDWGLAQDAVQEGFIVVSQKWDTFEPGGSVLAWVKGIVRFKALNIARSRQNDCPCGDEELFSLIDRQFDVHLTEEKLGHTERLKAALQECMKKLDEAGRTLLLGFYRDSLSFRELSSSMKRSENALRLYLSRIRKKLRLCADRQAAMDA